MAEAELSWIQRAADEAIEHAHRAGVKKIVCASGVSPSGPIHLGNLREVMTAHFVAEEIKSRGLDAVHVHSWDDYDRFRKVPAGLDESLAEQVERPLSAVPDPYGQRDSYASHFIAEFSDALDTLGVTMHEVRQSEQYPRGVYNAAIRQAMDRRGDVFDILARFQTEGLHDTPLAQHGHRLRGRGCGLPVPVRPCRHDVPRRRCADFREARVEGGLAHAVGPRRGRLRARRRRSSFTIEQLRLR